MNAPIRVEITVLPNSDHALARIQPRHYRAARNGIEQWLRHAPAHWAPCQIGMTERTYRRFFAHLHSVTGVAIVHAEPKPNQSNEESK